MQLHLYPFKAMGGPCELRLYGSRAEADRVAELLMAEVYRLERKYSRYREDSVVSTINRSAGQGAIEVDPETAALLDFANTCYDQSEGLFDITSGVLRQAWDFDASCLPDPMTLSDVLGRVGWRKVSWRRPWLNLPMRGMELDFGGYVKEYAADAAANLARAQGIRHGLVELGGDIAVIGAHPDGRCWEIGIRHPRHPEHALAILPLAQGGLASSGDYERFMEVEGKRYCHILDPRTGWPVQGLMGVSVVAEQCLIAGTATTIAMLKGEQGVEWLEALGLSYFAVTREGVVMTTRTDS